jgi:antagonist of KipI
MGLRLSGPAPLRAQTPAEILTEGVSLGAIQVTHDGSPIILFVDHQTTGGYPKIANVITADLHRLGQLRPRDRITFSAISLVEAHELLTEQESLFRQDIFDRL